VFSSSFSITLPNIEKYFPEIHFPKENYFLANKRGLKKEMLLEREKNSMLAQASGPFNSGLSPLPG
jgi:hypothetical protein